jgi:hypothetical protein
LHHAASLDAAESIAEVLTGLRSDIPAAMLNPLRSLSRDIARRLTKNREELFDWMSTMIEHASRAGQEEISFRSAAQTVDHLAAIRYRDELRPEMERLPAEMVEDLILETRTRLQTHPADKQLQRIILELYWKVGASEMSIRGLVELSLSQYESLATKASLRLAELARSSPRVKADRLRLLAKSPFAGIRRNYIEALIGIMDLNGVIPEKDLENVCCAVLTEYNPVVVDRSFEFTMRWIHKHRRISERAMESLIASMRHLLKTARINDGIARSLLMIFKTLAQTEDPHLTPGLRVWAEELITSVNIGKVNKGRPVATNLLIAIERTSPGYLATLVGKCQTMPPGNIYSIARAMKKAEGTQSMLLQQILHAEWCPPETKALILSFFGA